MKVKILELYFKLLRHLSSGVLIAIDKIHVAYHCSIRTQCLLPISGVLIGIDKIRAAHHSF